MKRLLAMAMIGCFLMGCARVPSAQRSERSIRHFFKKYGTKYPETPFGKGIEKVEVIKIHEIRKYVVVVEAFITLKNGDLKKVNTTLEKELFDWHFLSWEDPEGS